MLFEKMPSLQKLLELGRSIPYVPSKHLYRLVEYLLHKDKSEISIFIAELLSLKENIFLCDNCYCWKEKDEDCIWCSKEKDQKILCIVETWIDAISLERANIFQGVYHILGGNLSPLDGITHEQLYFARLIERIQELPLEEIIIGTNQTPEGEATASYIEKIVQKYKPSITISYLATGIPVGSSLAYVDRLTLGKAISYRRRLIK